MGVVCGQTHIALSPGKMCQFTQKVPEVVTDGSVLKQEVNERKRLTYQMGKNCNPYLQPEFFFPWGMGLPDLAKKVDQSPHPSCHLTLVPQRRTSYGLRVGKPAGTRPEGAPAECPFTQAFQLILPFHKGAPFEHFSIVWLQNSHNYAFHKLIKSELFGCPFKGSRGLGE